MDTSLASVTVNVVEPEIFVAESVAVIVVVPADADVALPIKPEAMLTVATSATEELQVTMVVMSCVVLSEYVPVAVNCCVVPLAMVGFVGVIDID